MYSICVNFLFYMPISISCVVKILQENLAGGSSSLKYDLPRHMMYTWLIYLRGD